MNPYLETRQVNAHMNARNGHLTPIHIYCKLSRCIHLVTVPQNAVTYGRKVSCVLKQMESWFVYKIWWENDDSLREKNGQAWNEYWVKLSHQYDLRSKYHERDPHDE